MLLIAALLVGCGTMKKSARTDTLSTQSEQTVVDRVAKTVGQTVEKTTETSVAEAGSERTTRTDTRIVETEFSTPDSLGNQFKVRETTTAVSVNETERRDTAGQIHKNTEITTTTQTADSLHIEANTAVRQSVTATDDRERKAGMADYLLISSLGIMLVFFGGLLYLRFR